MNNPTNRMIQNSNTVDTSSEQLKDIEAVLSRLAHGNLETRFTNLSQYGEYAGICSHVNDLVDKVETFFREAIGRMKDFADGESDQRIDQRGFEMVFQETVGHFNSNLEESDRRRKRQKEVSKTLQEFVSSLNETVDNLKMTAEILHGNAEHTLETAQVVQQDSLEAKDRTSEASISCNELTLAIEEISGHMQKATAVTFEAVESANETSKSMETLKDTGEQIGEFIVLIDGIAHQTNLLSLNATIEAARAGEAGRGFAVVANEVKNLASESRRSSKVISEQVDSMRTCTTQSVEAIQEITGVIDKINEIASSVAASTEEQGAATASIAGIMRSVTEKAEDIAKNIGEVANGAKQNNLIIDEVSEHVKGVLSISEKLKELSVQLDS